MRRLIDESELIEIIQGNEELLEFQKDECINCIKACDTAYDPDKVVDQLESELRLADKEKERWARENPLQFDSAKGYAMGLSNAIEIVKAGGTDDTH